VRAGIGDEFLMQPMAAGVHAIKFKVRAVHGGRMADFSCRCSGSSGGAGADHPSDVGSSP
jgi:hypothetical protein